MIKHTVVNRRETVTYYFHKKEHHDYALSGPNGENSNMMIQNAHTAYDTRNREFIKCRDVRVDVVNAMLLLKRHVKTHGKLSDEIIELIEDHV